MSFVVSNKIYNLFGPSHFMIQSFPSNFYFSFYKKICKSVCLLPCLIKLDIIIEKRVPCMLLAMSQITLSKLQVNNSTPC